MDKFYIKGKPTLNYELWEIAENVGMVFQNPSLQILASSVEEEILFGLENLGISRDAMKEILEETSRILNWKNSGLALQRHYPGVNNKNLPWRNYLQETRGSCPG